MQSWARSVLGQVPMTGTSYKASQYTPNHRIIEARENPLKCMQECLAACEGAHAQGTELEALLTFSRASKTHNP